MKNDKMEKINVNTDSYYDPNEKMNTGCLVKYFNDGQLALSIHNLKDGTKGYKVPDTNTGATVYFSKKDCNLFAENAKKMLKKYENEDKVKPVIIPLKKAVVELATVGQILQVLPNATGLSSYDENVLCLVLFADMDGKVAKATMIHVFSDKLTLSSYDPSNGSYSTIPDPVSECKHFIKSIDHYVSAMTNAYAHASTNKNAYQQQELKRLIHNIATASGLDLSNPYGKSSQRTPAISWSSGNSTADSSTSFSSRYNSNNNVKTETIEADEESLDAAIASLSL